MTTAGEYLVSQQQPFAAFEEWDGKVPRVASLLVKTPEQCPVCGAANHLCTGREAEVPPKKKSGRQLKPARVPTPDHLRDVDETPEEEVEVNEDLEATEASADEEAEVEAEENEEAADEAEEEAAEEAPKYPGAPADGIVNEHGKPLKVEGVMVGNDVLLTKPVYRAVLPKNSQRWVFHLMYPAGAKVLRTLVGEVVSPEN